MPARIFKYLIRSIANYTNAKINTIIENASNKEFVDNFISVIEHNVSVGTSIASSRGMAYLELAQQRLLLEHFKIDTLIDVGANIGQFATTMIGYGGFNGDLYSFEPVTKFYEKCVEGLDYWKAGMKSVTVENKAVGEFPGKTTINIGIGHGGTSSLLEQTGNLSKFAAGSDFDGTKQDVEVVRIDEYFKDLDFDNRRVFLKMDTQGFEGSILRSCGKLLEKFTLIQAELGGIEMYEGQTKPSYLFQLMEDNGFVPVCLFNNFGTENRAVFYDFDVVFARKSQIER